MPSQRGHRSLTPLCRQRLTASEGIGGVGVEYIDDTAGVPLIIVVGIPDYHRLWWRHWFWRWPETRAIKTMLS